MGGRSSAKPPQAGTGDIPSALPAGKTTDTFCQLELEMSTEAITTEESTQATPSAPDTSSASATPTPETAPQADAVPGADATSQTTPAQQPRSDGKDASSLTPPKPVASNTQSNEPVDPEAFKRLRDEKSQWGRQMAETKRQYEETRSQLAKLQQEREQAAQLAQNQKLALHDVRHPDHATKFQPILAKADIVRQQLAALNRAQPPAGLTTEQQQAWKESQQQAIMGTLSEEDQSALEQFQQHNQNFQRQWAINPTKVLTEHVIPMIRQEMQRAMVEQKASQEVDADLNDPQLGPVLKEFQPQMAEMINKLGGTDEAYDFAKHHAMVFAQNKQIHEENARLKQQLAEAGLKVNAAATQQNLAKGKASITKDVVNRTTKSSYEQAKEWAKANGIDTMHPAFHAKHREIEEELRGRK